MYNKTLILATLVVGVAACSPEGSSDVPAKPSSSAPAATIATQREVAQAGLGKLTGLVKDRQKHLKFGFRTPDEVDSAVLGDALPIYRVGLASLRSYHRGDDANALMVDTDTAFYPTVVDGKAVSGIMVGKENGAWAVTSLGRPTWAQAAQVTRERITAARGFAPSALAFVEVETPQVVLLVRHVEGGATLLTSVVDLPTAKLKAGEPLSAEDAIARLQSMVN